MVTLKIGDQDIDFMVDTGAELSMVTKPVAPLSKRTTAVTGVSGEEMVKSFCQPRKCQMGDHQVTHEFLYIPECPEPLLGSSTLPDSGLGLARQGPGTLGRSATCTGPFASSLSCHLKGGCLCCELGSPEAWVLL